MIGARARATRPIRTGSTAASARVFEGARIRSHASAASTSAELERGKRVKLRVVGLGVELLLERIGRHPHERPGAAREHRGVEGDDERLRQRGRDDHHLVSRAHLEAPVAQQPRERARIDHGAWSSGKCSVTCARIDSRTNRRSSPDAIR